MIETYALFKVLNTLLEEVGNHSVRGLAKKSKVAVGTAHYCTEYLLSKNIVTLQKIGRTYQYQLNQENVLTRHIQIVKTLGELQESGLEKELREKNTDIHSITLYGSAARGDDDPKSDLDIILIARKKVQINQLKAEQKLHRELNISTYTPTEWRAKAKKDKVFYDRVIMDGIALYGEIPKVD